MAEQRLHCIDILRGFAILLMIIAHYFKYWMHPDYFYILGIYFISLDPMGTPGFVYVSGVAFGYAWLKDVQKGLQGREFTLKNFSRTYILFIMAFGYNLIAVLLHGMHWADLWFWYILQTLLFCRVVAIMLMRAPQWVRAGVSIILIIITPIILTFLDPLKATNLTAAILFHLFFHPLYANGILFYLPFFLIGTILGERIFQISTKRRDFHKELGWWTGIGIIYVVVGIIVGSKLVTWDYGYNVLDFINSHPTIEWAGIPLFLITNSYAFILYATGWHFLLTALIFYFADLKPKQEKNKWKLEYYGQYSLTIYFGHYLLFLKNPQLTGVAIWFGLVFFIVFIWFAVYLIDRYSKGIYSLEHIMGVSAEYFFRRWTQQSTEGFWHKGFQIPKQERKSDPKKTEKTE